MYECYVQVRSQSPSEVWCVLLRLWVGAMVRQTWAQPPALPSWLCDRNKWLFPSCTCYFHVRESEVVEGVSLEPGKHHCGSHIWQVRWAFLALQMKKLRLGETCLAPGSPTRGQQNLCNHTQKVSQTVCCIGICFSPDWPKFLEPLYPRIIVVTEGAGVSWWRSKLVS